MWQTIARFGILAAAITLLLVVGEYALFLRPRPLFWMLAAVAALLLAAGLWLGRMANRRTHAVTRAQEEGVLLLK